MNSHDSRHDKLLGALFQDDAGAAGARMLAREGARRVQQRRARQIGASICGAACAVLCLVQFLGSAPSRNSPTPEQPQVVTAHGGDGIERIGDQELMAALKDRPVLVVQDATAVRQVVFLDQIQAR